MEEAVDLSSDRLLMMMIPKCLKCATLYRGSFKRKHLACRPGIVSPASPRQRSAHIPRNKELHTSSALSIIRTAKSIKLQRTGFEPGIQRNADWLNFVLKMLLVTILLPES